MGSDEDTSMKDEGGIKMEYKMRGNGWTEVEMMEMQKLEATEVQSEIC